MLVFPQKPCTHVIITLCPTCHYCKKQQTKKRTPCFIKLIFQNYFILFLDFQHIFYSRYLHLHYKKTD
jgi:hypothetical protein